MRADDVAARRYGTRAVTTAIAAMSTRVAPTPTMGAGGDTAARTARLILHESSAPRGRFHLALVTGPGCQEPFGAPAPHPPTLIIQSLQSSVRPWLCTSATAATPLPGMRASAGGYRPVYGGHSGGNSLRLRVFRPRVGTRLLAVAVAFVDCFVRFSVVDLRGARRHGERRRFLEEERDRGR